MNTSQAEGQGSVLRTLLLAAFVIGVLAFVGATWLKGVIVWGILQVFYLLPDAWNWLTRGF